jgi:hypothetical protein
VLSDGSVPAADAAGTVLHRSLLASQSLVTRSLAEVRLGQSIQNRQQFSVAGFIEGVGLGLAFSRRGAEANAGAIYAQNLPDRGCVFTVDLPRLEVRI